MTGQYYTICSAILLVLACHSYLALAFSDGTKLAHGNTATRRIYCHRSASTRKPLHFDAECGGFCQPRRNTEQFYTLNVSADTYWLDVIKVNISAKPDSGKSVTGFSIYGLDESGNVAGSFVDDDHDVTVGTCSDITMYNSETHGAFHKMADRKRKNVTIQWQPDGFNHGPVKFVIWIVHNHSEVYYVESKPLACRRNGSYSLDLESTLHDLVAAIDLKLFESNFGYRSKLGYHLDLDDPFSPFSNPPTEVEFVPLKTAEAITKEINNILSSGVGLGENSVGEVNDNNSTDDGILDVNSNDAMNVTGDGNEDDGGMDVLDNIIDDGNKDGDDKFVKNKDNDDAILSGVLDNGDSNDDGMVSITEIGTAKRDNDASSVIPTTDWEGVGNDIMNNINKTDSGDDSSISDALSWVALSDGDNSNNGSNVAASDNIIETTTTITATTVNDNPDPTNTNPTTEDTVIPTGATITANDTTDASIDNVTTTNDMTTSTMDTTTMEGAAAAATTNSNSDDVTTTANSGSMMDTTDQPVMDTNQPLFLFPF